MKSFEHRFALQIGLLSIKIKEEKLLSVLKFLHKIFPHKKWFIKIK